MDCNDCTANYVIDSIYVYNSNSDARYTQPYKYNAELLHSGIV